MNVDLSPEYCLSQLRIIEVNFLHALSPQSTSTSLSIIQINLLKFLVENKNQ